VGIHRQIPSPPKSQYSPLGQFRSRLPFDIRAKAVAPAESTSVSPVLFSRSIPAERFGLQATRGQKESCSARRLFAFALPDAHPSIRSLPEASTTSRETVFSAGRLLQHSSRETPFGSAHHVPSGQPN
jgi:hypothetical protein